MTQFGIWLVSLERFGGTYHAAGHQIIGATDASRCARKQPKTAVTAEDRLLFSGYGKR